MNVSLSIIIICKNEADSIERALSSVQSLSDDIVVYDSGSTDGTLDIVRRFGVQLHTGPWLGFGATRQKAALLGRHDWVLVVDADEVVTDALAAELRQLRLDDPDTAYSIELYNYLGKKHIRWGSWGKDFRVRLYHRDKIAWTPKIVHETLDIPSTVRIRPLQHPILHFTATSFEALTEKMRSYARLTAAQYYSSGKRPSVIKIALGPLFTFVKSYLLKLGFLDGAAGYRLATLLAHYTHQKYEHLQRLWKEKA